MLSRYPHLQPGRCEQGFSIIELMIAITVIGVFIALGLPAYSEFLQNAKIRGAAESLMAGIQFAKSEALRRNTSVRFQLMNTLDTSCRAQPNGKNWVVSLQDPAGNCGVPDESKEPFILQTRSSSEGGGDVLVFQADGGKEGNHTLIFTGLGRLQVNNFDSFGFVDISNPAGGTCKHDPSIGKMRCLRVQVTQSGDARLCDPAVTNTDPRKC